ncbi:synaptobrevin-domain-containing protein [Meredithblackwellia eburnea MCA 4105]
MSLLHALIASRDTIILVEHDASPTGGQSYAQATQTILSKIPPNDSKLTYAADSILIHYQKSNGVVALVVAEDSAGRRMPFAFLAELHKRFLAAYGQDEINDAPAYGMAGWEKEVAKLMQQYTDSPPNDPIKVAQAELASVKDIMVKNIDAVLSRGERIELLVDKTDGLSTQARAFRKRSTQLRRKMWWKNIKVIILIIFSSILLLYFFIAFFCGLGLHCGA